MPEAGSEGRRGGGWRARTGKTSAARDPPAAAAADPAALPRPCRGGAEYLPPPALVWDSGSQTVVSVRLFVPSPAESSSSPGSACTAEVCGFPQSREVWPCLPMGV